MSTLALARRPQESLSALERLEVLCDPDSLKLIRSEVTSRHMGERIRSNDGVVAGAGRVDGQPIFCYAQDATYVGGSLGEAHAETIVRVMRLAHRSQAPVVGFVGSGGARMQEGIAALGGYGRIFREIVLMSGKVPQISIITGLSAGGGAYSPALTDWVVMTRESSMFLTGPTVVREALGEEVTAERLGGSRVHERNGVCQFVADSDVEGAHLARDLLGYLPTGPDKRPMGHSPGRRRRATRRFRPGGRVGGCMTSATSSAAWSTVGSCSRSAPDGRGSIVTGFARIDGRTVGVIANQPRYLGGVLDARQLSEGRAVRGKCNAFGIPLLVLVDTPGYMPGRRQESAGVIRFGAGLCMPLRRPPSPGHGDSAQGVRRRIHHDEFEGPRGRLRVRVAGGWIGVMGAPQRWASFIAASWRRQMIRR